MIRHAAWSAPANALIAGEYLITRTGGTGIAVATNPRGTLKLRESGTSSSVFAFDGGGGIRIRSKMGTTPIYWPETDHPFLHSIITGFLHRYPIASSRVWDIEIDTNSFFEKNTGKKRGLGSSAVATLLLVTALHALHQGRQLKEEQKRDIAMVAIDLHRAAHGGIGSGYDIAVSAVGGVITFTGGITPSFAQTTRGEVWSQIPVDLYSWSAETPVSSATAVERFLQRVPVDSEIEEKLRERTGQAVRSIVAANTWNALFRAVAESRDAGLDLGERIGVSAALPFVRSHRDDGWIAKASGAGNERAIIFADPQHRRPLPEGANRLEIDTVGLREEAFFL